VARPKCDAFRTFLETGLSHMQQLQSPGCRDLPATEIGYALAEE
jgi:hypothetical protein